MKKYQILVKTNSYAGNFERELCAYMTGHVGECGVGDKLVEAESHERFMDKIVDMPDDNGTYRPVALDEANTNNIVIFLADKISDEDVQFLHDRALEFQDSRPYEYLDKNFKYLGLEQIEIKTITNKV